MTRIVLQSKTGPDGVLHLDVPLGEANASYDIELTAQRKPAKTALPAEYFDLIGSIDDETFVIHHQPTAPPPVKFE